MTLIVQDIATIKENATVDNNFDYNIIKPHLRKADRKYIKKVIGNDMYNELTASSLTGDKLEAQKLFQEASANIALLYYTKVGNVTSANGGLVLNTGQNAKPAEWWMVRDLRRQLLETGMEAIDDALELMEQHSGTDFDIWKNSEHYTVFKETFVSNTPQFQRGFNINESRYTFRYLKPIISLVHDKYFADHLPEATISTIISADTAVEKKALELARKAQIAFTIAEAAEQGMFIFKSGGIFVKTDEIKGKETSALDINQVNNLRIKKQTDGNEYYKKLVEHLESHPDVFTDFANKEKETAVSPVINKGSHISL